MPCLRRTKFSWKRAVRRILIVVLVLTMLSVAGSSSAFWVIFRRTPPPDLGPAPSFEDVDAARYPYEQVSFPSGENMLTGHWFPAPDPVGTVLIVHGFASSGEAHLIEAMYFRDNGFSVLVYDATGMGESEGDSVVGLCQSRWDVIAAVGYLRDNHPDTPLFLYGHSMGGYGVLAALAEVEADGVVCVNGFRSPVSLMHLTARRYVGILADFGYPFILLQNHLTFGSDGNADALETAGQTQVPVLILNARDDATVPQKAQLQPGDTEYENIEFCTIDGGHTGIWLAEDQRTANTQLLDRIVSFYLSTQ